jgi:hypothetical protein
MVALAGKAWGTMAGRGAESKAAAFEAPLSATENGRLAQPAGLRGYSPR